MTVRTVVPQGAVKICGLSTPDTLEAALEAGADLVGFVFFPPSPRHVDLDTAARLAAQLRGRALTVALTVDADDAALDAILDAVVPDLVQLHGRETPERVASVERRRPVLKAVGIAGADDLARLGHYAEADLLLLDAKPPPRSASGGAPLPGGNGRAFDWRLLAGLDPQLPFMLSGGLDAGTVGEAVAVARPHAVDVSSGVETAPGVKDPERIHAFVAAARAAFAAG